MLLTRIGQMGNTTAIYFAVCGLLENAIGISKLFSFKKELVRVGKYSKSKQIALLRQQHELAKRAEELEDENFRHTVSGDTGGLFFDQKSHSKNIKAVRQDFMANRKFNYLSNADGSIVNEEQSQRSSRASFQSQLTSTDREQFNMLDQ